MLYLRGGRSARFRPSFTGISYRCPRRAEFSNSSRPAVAGQGPVSPAGHWPQSLRLTVAPELRHQLAMPNVNKAALQIVGDVVVIFGHPLKLVRHLPIGYAARQPPGTCGLLSIVGHLLHFRLFWLDVC
jgi:hypothetical protein